MFIMDFQEPSQYVLFRKALKIQLLTVLLHRAILFVPLVIQCASRVRKTQYTSGNLMMGPVLLVMVVNIVVLVDVIKQAMVWLPRRPERGSDSIPPCEERDSPPTPAAFKRARHAKGSDGRREKTRKVKLEARGPSQKYQATPSEAVRFGKSRTVGSEMPRCPCPSRAAGRSDVQGRRGGGLSFDEGASDSSDLTFGEDDLDDSSPGCSKMGRNEIRQAEEEAMREAEMRAARRKKVTDDVKERLRRNEELKRSQERNAARRERCSTRGENGLPFRRDAEFASPPSVDHSLIYATGQPAKGTHYEMLGVWRSADDSEIRRAFHRLSKRWHPDKNPEHATESEVVFKCIKAAYETLSDPGKRRTYDKQLASTTDLR